MKNLRKIFENRKKIFEGIKNNLFKSEDVEAIAKERMEECNKCDLIDLEGTKCMIPGTAPCCGECGCKLGYKTRSLSSSCTHPDGPKWEAVLDQDEEDKVYQSINYNPDDHGNQA